MAILKQIYLPYYSSGAVGLYARIYQVATGFWLDSTDGAFKVIPTNYRSPLTESSPSIYYLGENRSVWSNGQYQIWDYDATDYLFSGAEMYILSDREVSQATLLEYMELIKKIEEGNWELVGNQWIYYDADGITPLCRFNLKDSAGNPSMINISKREKV